MRFSIDDRLMCIALRAGLASLSIVITQTSPAGAAAEQLMYSFQGGTDGAIQYSGLTEIGGMFYGTTTEGGASPNCTNGCGTVFIMNARTGTDTIVYPFQGGSDGADPQASLINVGGIVYGTTNQGGANANGTVFSLDLTTGHETPMYSFAGGTDGANPQADLIIGNSGLFYGTTYSGGGSANCSSGCGTVFSFNPTTNVEAPLYSFQGGTADGANPHADLLNTAGQLFGTTTQGGTGTANCSSGCGTVFSVNLNGGETPLYSFQGGSNDGAFPTSGLVRVGSLLYGTTEYGGTGNCSNNGYTGCGTVYSISQSGSETLLYSFQGTSERNDDGAYPTAGLLDVKGTLWGTTTSGGDIRCGIAGGCGVVFSMTTAGVEKVQWTFQGGSYDGATPYAALIRAANVLYGTTSVGGGTGCSDDEGCGTLFRISAISRRLTSHGVTGSKQ